MEDTVITARRGEREGVLTLPHFTHQLDQFGPVHPSRGRNASSRVICTNFGVFQGHASWEFCRFTTFVVNLSTGRNRMTSVD
jgi:hypothetical protein